MAKTIVGLFDDQQKAQAVLRELANAGFPASDIDCIKVQDEASRSDLVSRLTRAGVPREEIQHYSSAVDGGNSIFILRTTDEAVQRALTVLERYGVKDLDQRSGSATAGFSESETTSLSKAGEGSTSRAIPVVEEELKVGKRQMSAGGVRIYTRVSEQPVEQDVSLRKEDVEVERRPANRPATEQDLRAFKEGTVEVTATAEEPIIAKEAKVVEEVVVSKDVTQERQAIRDTVRRTEVDVDDRAGQTPDGELGQHRGAVMGENDSGKNLTPVNDDYAVDYGRTLAADPRYRGKDWAAIEPEANREWGAHHKGAWEEFKER
ncbi:MAG TPA: YsnF/AvaK domain-containing protein, partial [Candidatus Binataceae bacterium]|nr:YsnF/AvaK domain-containing protein [Candidatus Binataceae bacterium]